MVHALKEAWRVLVQGGIMIDVRPLSIVVPLEVVYDGGNQLAGMADMSPGLKDDIAADKAIDTVVNNGIFTQASLETFDYVYFWKTYHGMVADFAERWQDEIIISKETFDKAKRLYKQKRVKTMMRLPMRMILGKYEKQG